MNKHAKRKWVEALRSGEYKKTTGRLGIIESVFGRSAGYCCLGVFAEEMVPEFVREKGTKIYVDENDGYLPDDLAIMYDLSTDEQEILAELNDDHDTFGPIADYIEREL